GQMLERSGQGNVRPYHVPRVHPGAGLGQGPGAARTAGGRRTHAKQGSVLVADRTGGAGVPRRPPRRGGGAAGTEFEGRRQARPGRVELAVAVAGGTAPRQADGGADLAGQGDEGAGRGTPGTRGARRRQGAAPAQLAGGPGPAPRGGEAARAEAVVPAWEVPLETSQGLLQQADQLRVAPPCSLETGVTASKALSTGAVP